MDGAAACLCAHELQPTGTNQTIEQTTCLFSVKPTAERLTPDFRQRLLGCSNIEFPCQKGQKGRKGAQGHDRDPLSDLPDLSGIGDPEKSSGLERHLWTARPPSWSSPASTNRREPSHRAGCVFVQQQAGGRPPHDGFPAMSCGLLEYRVSVSERPERSERCSGS